MSAAPYRLVIFDFDGTLADSFGWFLDVFDEVADRFRFRRLDRERLDHLRGLSTQDLLRHHGVPLWKVPMIAAHARTLQAHTLKTQPAHGIAVFAGMDAVVTGLRARSVRLALVSSNARGNIERILPPHTMTAFDHVACGASLFGKTAKFRAALKTTGVEARHALAIGDEVRDIEAARQAGMASGAVTWGYAAADRLRLERPDHVFDRPEAITDLFDAAD